MRAKIAVGWVFAAALAPGIADAERILLIPLDSRPAAGHFAQMIGAMADVTVEMPPLDPRARHDPIVRRIQGGGEFGVEHDARGQIMAGADDDGAKG